MKQVVGRWLLLALAVGSPACDCGGGTSSMPDALVCDGSSCDGAIVDSSLDTARSSDGMVGDTGPVRSCESATAGWIETVDMISAPLRTCAADSDCMVVDVDLRCSGALYDICPRAVSVSDEDRFKTDVESARTQYCMDSAVSCNSNGCLADFVPRCTSGICALERL